MTHQSVQGNVVYAISAIPLTDAQVEVVGSLMNQQQQAGPAGTKPAVGAAAQPAVGDVVQPTPAGGGKLLVQSTLMHDKCSSPAFTP